ncbi:hypothetical protein PTHTG4_09760 [Parageobacillus thermoglucosidasius]|uniref:hypothetical protein n=1 Tax=Parageobacillus thermoglucosidasius TaxID=1426 RepID=UPI000FFAC536|nr:hypothetical protein [Parageobacillus thermoglucosidasius]GCD81914.1 hypothetical protein PTHTG4_09760 [Parageobacillus thermoglucosidasius]
MKSLIITIIFFVLSLIFAVAIAVLQKSINKYPFQTMMLTLVFGGLTLQIVILFILLHN